MDIIRAEGLVYPQEGVNITFPCHVRAEILSWVSTIPPEKLLVMVFPGPRKKVPHILWAFFLTFKSVFRIFNLPKSEFLVRQAKPGESSWLRSQPDKVSRPSEPSFAFMRATVWVKRKQGDSRP